MKILKILFFFLFCAYFTSNAQQHQTFKNIPITGNIVSLSNELKKSGFNLLEVDNNIVLMNGDFIGYNCEIYIVGSLKTKTAWRVIVYLPEESNWYFIKDQYYTLKKQLQEKYGDGESYEFFSSPYYEGDGFEMSALSIDKCVYHTYFKTNLGYVTLSISKYHQISISYEDDANTDIKDKEENNIIKNDI